MIVEFKGYCNDSIVKPSGDKIIFNAYNCQLTKKKYSVERKLSCGLFSRVTDGTTCNINSETINKIDYPLVGKKFIIKGFIQETEDEFHHRESKGKVYRNSGHQSPIIYECDENGNIFMPNHEKVTQELISTYNQKFYIHPDEV